MKESFYFMALSASKYLNFNFYINNKFTKKKNKKTIASFIQTIDVETSGGDDTADNAE